MRGAPRRALQPSGVARENLCHTGRVIFGISLEEFSILSGQLNRHFRCVHGGTMPFFEEKSKWTMTGFIPMQPQIAEGSRGERNGVKLGA